MKVFLPFVFVVLVSTLPLAAQHKIASHPIAVQAAEYASQGKYADAIATIGKLIELNSNESILVLARAQYYKLAGDLINSRKDIERAAALAPNDVTILIGIERTLRVGDSEGCERVLEFADSHYARFPQSSAILGIRARTKHCLGDFVGAFNDNSLAIELDPRETAYRINRTNALDRIGDRDQALKLLAELIDSLKTTIATSKDPEEKAAAKRELPSAFSFRARIYERNGDNELALADLTKAVELSDEETFLLERFGLLMRMQRPPEAAAAISAVIECRKQKRELIGSASLQPDSQARLEKTDATLFATRGDLYVQLGKYDEAIADYALSAKLDPTTKDASEKKIAAAKQMKVSSPK